MSQLLKHKQQIIKNIRLYLSCHFSIDVAFRKVAQLYTNETKKILVQCASSLESGLSPSVVMLSCGFVTKQESALLAAGEMSGYLHDALLNIENLLVKEKEIKQICLQALLYPIIICVLTSCLVGFLLFFIFPQVIPIFNSFGQKLPFATRSLLFIYQIISASVWYIVALLCIVFGVSYLYKKQFMLLFRRIILFLLIKTPILKSCYIEYSCALWARHTSLMIRRGVPFKDIFLLVGEITDHPDIIATSEKIVRNLEHGLPISDAFSDQVLVLKDIKNIVSAGEETGMLEDCFFQISIFYEEKVSQTIKKLTIILEPLLLILMGGCVGIIAYAMVAPMYQLTTHITH